MSPSVEAVSSAAKASGGSGRVGPPGCAWQGAFLMKNMWTPMAVVVQWPGGAWPPPALWFQGLWHLVVSEAEEGTAGVYGVGAWGWWVGEWEW